MKRLKQILPWCLFFCFFTACKFITITPRSKRNIYRERPSTLLLDKIIDFRLVQLGWPVSKKDFMSYGVQYYKSFEGFPYSYTWFKIIDSNKMIFYFSGHFQDERNYRKTNKIDLNSYHGRVTFYKVENKFVWKLKMR